MYIVSKLFLERVIGSLFVNPMTFLHLFILSSTCWLKSSLESKISPRCFWAGAYYILLLLKVKDLWGTLSCLCKKQTSVGCLVGSGLNSIFHWGAHWLINFKSLLGSISDFLLLIAFEKSDVSPANILQTRLLCQVIHFIRNNNGPKLILAEHLLKGFSMKTFFHLKGSVAIDLSDNL